MSPRVRLSSSYSPANIYWSGLEYNVSPVLQEQREKMCLAYCYFSWMFDLHHAERRVLYQEAIFIFICRSLVHLAVDVQTFCFRPDASHDSLSSAPGKFLSRLEVTVAGHGLSDSQKVILGWAIILILLVPCRLSSLWLVGKTELFMRQRIDSHCYGSKTSKKPLNLLLVSWNWASVCNSSSGWECLL